MSVTLEDPIKEVADLMESSKEEGWERSQANKQVTFVVYREGDQLNFFRVVDRGDGTLTPLSDSLRFKDFSFSGPVNIKFDSLISSYFYIILSSTCYSSQSYANLENNVSIDK